ncbi:class I SAM-dependent methyltransferase [Leifsonia sp. A12D58]|uniref:class I SAM-dependent methyltransferase n=1 Tax=Leifsonia sp. A12D58 TaxID=3397674 RepID=UPI0039E024BB
MTVPLIDLLRADLASANYSVTALTGLWGVEADAALHRNQRVPALRALKALRQKLGRPERSATLAQLFVLGLPVTRADLDAALPTLGTTGALELGLVEPDTAPDLLRPLLDLRPYSFIDAQGAGSWWIASDLGELALGHALGENHVLGVGGASLTLAGLVLPNPVSSALDLGTGCGIQAMHAARHADRVVATDISERALELAALNARLNGITNIEFRLGSLFEPVAGERFDHIISNPPFVITPRTEGVPSYEYRDGGLVGDAIVEAVVTGAAAHLTPGGVAQLLGNWEYRTNVDAFDRMTAWLDRPESGNLDAWIIEREVELPTEYAETWIRDGGTRPDTPDFDRLYGAWLDDFAARNVAKVGFGYMLLRAPVEGPAASAAPFRRLERLLGSLGQNSSGLGTYLAECLAAHDWQAATNDDALSRAHLIVAPDVTEERHYWPGNDDPTLMTLHQGAGFGRTVPLDTALAALIGACDGDLSVAAIIGALSQLLEVDEDALTADLLPRLRELLDDGFLRAPSE